MTLTGSIDRAGDRGCDCHGPSLTVRPSPSQACQCAGGSVTVTVPGPPSQRRQAREAELELRLAGPGSAQGGRGPAIIRSPALSLPVDHPERLPLSDPSPSVSVRRRGSPRDILKFG